MYGLKRRANTYLPFKKRENNIDVHANTELDCSGINVTQDKEESSQKDQYQGSEKIFAERIFQRKNTSRRKGGGEIPLNLWSIGRFIDSFRNTFE